MSEQPHWSENNQYPPLLQFYEHVEFGVGTQVPDIGRAVLDHFITNFIPLNKRFQDREIGHITAAKGLYTIDQACSYTFKQLNVETPATEETTARGGMTRLTEDWILSKYPIKSKTQAARDAVSQGMGLVFYLLTNHVGNNIFRLLNKVETIDIKKAFEAPNYKSVENLTLAGMARFNLIPEDHVNLLKAIEAATWMNPLPRFLIDGANMGYIVTASLWPHVYAGVNNSKLSLDAESANTSHKSDILPDCNGPAVQDLINLVGPKFPEDKRES
ncbi:hypothetical protein HGB07_01725 [Candidatus Roizmanbacteria bacterium]|nr:hypothetical protein [Candidatus Roizmanbacteria bacterium]